MQTKTIVTIAAVVGVAGLAYWFFFRKKKAAPTGAGTTLPPATGSTQCQQVAAAINRSQPLGKMKSNPIKQCRNAGGTVSWVNQGTRQQKQVCVCRAG